MDFANLPPELQYKIFSYLNETELELSVIPTCRQWKKIAHDPIFRKNVTLNGRKNTQDEISKEINRSYLVQNLTFHRIKQWDWLNQASQLNVLRHVYFNSCKISSLVLSHLVRLSPLVQCVKFVNCTTINCDVIGEVVRWKYLLSISLHLSENCEGNECLNIITEHCENLEKIEISWNFQRITDKSFLSFIQRRGAKLTALDLNCSQLSRKCFSAISRCSQIANLILQKAENMTDDELMSLKNLRYLRVLTITNGNKLTAKGFQRFFREAHFPHLCTLLLRNCNKFSNKSAKPIGNSCPALQSLFLTHTQNISDNGIKAIISKCKQLEEIWINGLNQVNGLWIRDITLKLSHLIFLYIGKCSNINFEALECTSKQNPKLKIAYVVH